MADDATPEVMSEKEIARALGGEIERVSSSPFTSEEVSAIGSWDDIVGLLESKNIVTAVVSDVLGDGFTPLMGEAKMQLVGMPLHILDWEFHQGKQGRFVAARAFVKTGPLSTDIRKVRIIDFSAKSGICQQLTDATAKLGRQDSLTCKNGIIVSQYDYDDPNTGEKKLAQTFYLSEIP